MTDILQRSPDGVTGWTDIPGTTDLASYVIPSSDVGYYYRVKETVAGVTVYSAVKGPVGSGAGGTGIYWGAWIDGPTLAQYYGGSWSTVPFDSGGASQSKFETDAAKTMSMCHFGNGDDSTAGFWTIGSRTGDLDTILGRLCYPVLDISTGTSRLEDVANGNFDTAINSWLTNLKTWGKPVILRLNWEMQGTWFPWGFDSAHQDTSSVATHQTNYKNCWQHIVGLANALGITNISWNWCPNYVLTSTDATKMQNYYPGDAYVDWAGFDIYQDDAKVADGNSQGSFSALAGLSYSTIAGFTSKPQCIGEVGCWEFSATPHGGPTTKGAWLTDMFSYIKSSMPNVRSVLYFNYNAIAASSNAIESSADSLSGFQAGVADSYYKSKLASVNSSGKVPVP